MINPAGYGHTSVALLDALKTLGDPDRRMPPVATRPRARTFRHQTYVSLAATGVVSRLRRREL